MRRCRLLVAALLLAALAGCAGSALGPGVAHYNPYQRDDNLLQHGGGESGGGEGGSGM